jgi:hypothetical protein
MCKGCARKNTHTHTLTLARPPAHPPVHPPPYGSDDFVAKDANCCQIHFFGRRYDWGDEKWQWIEEKDLSCPAKLAAFVASWKEQRWALGSLV